MFPPIVVRAIASWSCLVIRFLQNLCYIRTNDVDFFHFIYWDSRFSFLYPRNILVVCGFFRPNCSLVFLSCLKFQSIVLCCISLFEFFQELFLISKEQLIDFVSLDPLIVPAYRITRRSDHLFQIIAVSYEIFSLNSGSLRLILNLDAVFLATLITSVDGFGQCR